jgi:Ca2+/Na+ antiporter
VPRLNTVVTISEATVMLIIYGSYILVTFFGPMGARSAYHPLTLSCMALPQVVSHRADLTRLAGCCCARLAMRKYTVWQYGPLPRDMVQQNFVEQRREEQRLQQSSELTSVGGGISGGGIEGGHVDSDDDDDDDDDDNAPAGDILTLEWWMALVPKFFRLVFSYTCPDCSEGAPHETWYPITLGVSFGWVTFFSGLISDIVGLWEEKLGVSTIILGITLVAVGGEVPDTIQSLAVAKKGYGSLAVANCLGAQVANIGFGLGLPWFLSALWDQPVVLNGHAEVQTLVWFHVVGISIFTFITLGLVVTPLLYSKPIEPKATLTPSKGLVLIVSYIVIITSYVITCQLNDSMSLNISFGATQIFFLIVLAGLGAAAWTSRRMRMRHRAELRKAGLLPKQMESEFNRMKAKRQGVQKPPNHAKVKATPPNSSGPTPQDTPPRGGGGGGAGGSGGGGGTGSSFARVDLGNGVGPGRKASGGGGGGNSYGYTEEVSWEEDAAPMQQEDEEIDATTAAAMAIAQSNPDDVNELQVRPFCH